MYLTKEKADEIINDFKSDITNDFKSRLLFITNLIEDEDWAFVIKAHSLIECLMNELIDRYIEKPELKDTIGRLPLHGEYISKISFAKKLQAINSEEVRFILSLSELRNMLVHKFEHIDFKFDVYVGKMNKDQIKKLNLALKVYTDQSESYIIKVSDNSLKIKLAYWNSLYTLIINLIERTHAKNASNRNEKEAIATSIGLIRGIFKES